MIVSKVYDREEPWKPKTSGAFCASSDENAVLARVFEEYRDNEKNCFRVGKRWMHCHIEATYRVNILAVQHLFRTVRCIVRNISLYIQRTELMQQSVAMVPSGSVREGSS